jgi:Alternative complex III, ActD subunit
MRKKVSTAVESLYALYASPESADRAFLSLCDAGISRRDIVVASSEPFHDFEFGKVESRSITSWAPVLGGILGSAAGYLLAVLAQRAYPLNTGGMPLAPLWTNGIITYELAMLGVILAALLALSFSARLPSWRQRLYDPAISEGMIMVGMENPSEASRRDIEECLRQAGPVEVKSPRASQ